MRFERNYHRLSQALMQHNYRTMKLTRIRKLVVTHSKPSMFHVSLLLTFSVQQYSDHIEGEATIAEKNAHANDDGVIDRQEKKAIERAHKKQLANRQRGINGFRPYRTAIWMKEGIKSRIVPTKASARRERMFTL